MTLDYLLIQRHNTDVGSQQKVQLSFTLQV